jgi:hypothetical protein
LELLQTHLSHSSPQYGPYFVLRDANANIHSNIKICGPSNDNPSNTNKDLYQQHLYLVWTLVYALWGKLDSIAPTDGEGSSSDSTDRPLSTHLLRKLAISKWLSQALLVPIEDSAKVFFLPYSSIFFRFNVQH